MGLLFTPKSAKEILQERGEKIGEERGLRTGEERGVARANSEFADWYARMKQAEREGKNFNEPPPFLYENDNEHNK